jgi:hypothetical protein
MHIKEEWTRLNCEVAMKDTHVLHPKIFKGHPPTSL